QPRFEGSLRQLRGRVLNALREGPHSRRELTKTLAGVEGVRSDEVLDGLVRDGLVTRTARTYALAGG
ncbi:MAG TPA: hypothetical protein VMV11_04780, partial [Acidimicrobiales bacterium]|nr:hypothetical protein [Acidimicrobiales bacterium]